MQRRTIVTLRCLLLAHLAVAAYAARAEEVPPAVPSGRVKNIVTDYGASPKMPWAEITDIVQKAVDDVGAAGGGTVVIPANAAEWNFTRPIFVGWPNVTIAGDGRGTQINGTATLFVLGAKLAYPEAPITSRHFPVISGPAGIYDSSVTGTKYGMRTTDGMTPASGYLPSCPMTFGGIIPHLETDGSDYWKDMARGVHLPIRWQGSRYTLNLIIRNNSQAVIKGTLCGIGPGGQTDAQTTGTIADPLNIWTIESDKGTGANLSFRMKLLDPQGKETVKSLMLSREPVGRGVMRISVQLDFDTGACRAWYSLSQATPVPQTMNARVDLGAGYHFKPLEYGTFRIGSVVDSPFAGSPPSEPGASGDWTVGGYSLYCQPLFSQAGANDAVGAPIRLASDDRSSPTDSAIYFPDYQDPKAISFLPLSEQPVNSLAKFQNGGGFDYRPGWGYWMPRRPLKAIGGTMTVRDMQFNGGFIATGDAICDAEAAHISVSNVYYLAGYYHGVGSWDCGPPNAKVDVKTCLMGGGDALYYGKSQKVSLSNITGGTCNACIRLVGCQGEISNMLVNSFTSTDYYVKVHSGPLGGPLSLRSFFFDNEGMDFIPRKACIYLEPSLNPGPGGNKFSISSELYTGVIPKGGSVVELADPPGVTASNVTGSLTIDYIDLSAWPSSPPDNLVSIKSRRWSGLVMNTAYEWLEVNYLKYGFIHYVGVPESDKFVTFSNELHKLPSKGTWLAGSHIVRLPDPLGDPMKQIVYRCVRTGTYGTAQEPKWEVIR